MMEARPSFFIIIHPILHLLQPPSTFSPPVLATLPGGRQALVLRLRVRPALLQLLPACGRTSKRDVVRV